MLKWKPQCKVKVYADRKMWFSMWFLGAIVTFGLAFFPMFYRLIEAETGIFNMKQNLKNKLLLTLKSQGKEPPATSERFKRNAKAWAASIILMFQFSSLFTCCPRICWFMNEIRTLFLLLLFQSGCLCRRRYR